MPHKAPAGFYVGPLPDQIGIWKWFLGGKKTRVPREKPLEH